MSIPQLELTITRERLTAPAHSCLQAYVTMTHLIPFLFSNSQYDILSKRSSLWCCSARGAGSMAVVGWLSDSLILKCSCRAINIPSLPHCWTPMNFLTGRWRCFSRWMTVMATEQWSVYLSVSAQDTSNVSRGKLSYIYFITPQKIKSKELMATEASNCSLLLEEI